MNTFVFLLRLKRVNPHVELRACAQDTAPAYLLATTDGVLAAVNNRLDRISVGLVALCGGRCVGGAADKNAYARIIGDPSRLGARLI